LTDFIQANMREFMTLNWYAIITLELSYIVKKRLLFKHFWVI